MGSKMFERSAVDATVEKYNFFSDFLEHWIFLFLDSECNVAAECIFGVIIHGNDSTFVNRSRVIHSIVSMDRQLYLPTTAIWAENMTQNAIRDSLYLSNKMPCTESSALERQKTLPHSNAMASAKHKYKRYQFEQFLPGLGYI
jgi:hypothetical protein